VARGLLNLPLPRLWDLLFLIPFLTPPYIAALSWMLVLQTNGYLQQLTGFNLNDVLFSQTGIVLVMALNIFPVVYFAVSRSLLASGQRLALVARVHGASPGRAFWHITLPMLSPSLAAGMLLAFTLAIEEYGVPAALGTRAGVLMLTTDIEKKLAEWPIDLSGASMLSVVLVTLALSAWWLQKKLTGNQDDRQTDREHGRRCGELYPADSGAAGVDRVCRGDPAGCLDGLIRSAGHLVGRGVSRQSDRFPLCGAVQSAGGCAVGAGHQPVAGAGGGLHHRLARPACCMAGGGAED